jgi:hypothetical protein
MRHLAAPPARWLGLEGRTIQTKAGVISRPERHQLPLPVGNRGVTRNSAPLFKKFVTSVTAFPIRED